MDATVCTLCPRACRADRAFSFDPADRRGGACGMPHAPVVARAALHFGEEPVLSGTRGAGAVFFSGCPLKCVFCQNFELSRGRTGIEITPARLADIFRELEAQGAHNIDLVNPGHFAPAVRAALAIYRPRIPIVWNSSGYETVESLRAMEGLVDIYLPDMKYVSAQTAARCSGAPDYFPVASKALREMLRQTGPAVLDGDGLMRRGTIVRHLVLPGLVGETRKALVWIRRALPDAWLSLMAQYTPCGDARLYPPLDRPLARAEYDEVVACAEALGFENGFFQEMEAADEAEIPLFDGTGVLPSNGGEM